jgi:hypothetical protein
MKTSFQKAEEKNILSLKHIQANQSLYSHINKKVIAVHAGHYQILKEMN